jgi:hypothetical protein
MEHQLHEHFFPGDASPAPGDGGGLEPLMEPLCTVLYDVLRPQFILLQRLDDLCELVDILKHEVLLHCFAGAVLLAVQHGSTPAAVPPSMRQQLYHDSAATY